MPPRNPAAALKDENFELSGNVLDGTVDRANAARPYRTLLSAEGPETGSPPPIKRGLRSPWMDTGQWSVQACCVLTKNN